MEKTALITSCFEKKGNVYVSMCPKFKKTIEFMDKNPTEANILLKQAIGGNGRSAEAYDNKNCCVFAVANITFSRNKKVMVNVIECPFEEKKILVPHPKRGR